MRFEWPTSRDSCPGSLVPTVAAINLVRVPQDQVEDGSKPSHSLEPPSCCSLAHTPLADSRFPSLSVIHCDTAKGQCTRMWEPYYLRLSVTRIMNQMNHFRQEEPCLGHFTVAAENGLGYWKIKHLASNETKFISRSFPGLQNAAVSRHRFGISRHRCGSQQIVTFLVVQLDQFV